MKMISLGHKTFIKLILFLISVSIILIFYMKYNVVTCEEIIISKGLMKELREELYKALVSLTKDPSFQETYCNRSKIFNILYIYNTNYIKDFLEHLPLEQIINENIHKGFDVIAEIILDLFVKDLMVQLISFQNKTYMLSHLFFTSKIVIPNFLDTELFMHLKQMQHFIATPHPEATEDTWIITKESRNLYDRYCDRELEIIIKWTYIKFMLGGIHLEGNHASCIIKFYYMFNVYNIPLLLPPFEYKTGPILPPSPETLFFWCQTLWFIFFYLKA